MEKKESSYDKKKIQDLTKLASIGNLTARALIDLGYDSLTDLKNTDIDDLTSIEGIGDKLSEDIIKDLESEEYKKDEETNLEFHCPVCKKIIKSDSEKCQECEEDIRLISEIILPDRGVIENPRKTLAEIEENLKDDEKDVESWFIRGSILEGMGANRKALNSFDRVIELDPLFDNVWNAKAHVSLKIGETKEAAKAYRLAYDVHGLPINLVEEVEKKDMSSAEKIEEIKKIDQKEKKTDETVSRARNMLGDLKRDEREIRELRKILDNATEDKIHGEIEEAMKKAKNVIKKCEIINKTENNISEFEEKLRKIDKKDMKERFEKDIVEIQGMMKDFNYEEAERVSRHLEEALEFEKQRFEEKIELREEYDEQIDELKKIAEKVPSELSKLISIEESIKTAKKSLKDDEIKKASEIIKKYLDHKSVILDISEKLDKIEALEMGLEGLNESRDEYFGEIDEKIENVKKKCEEGEFNDAKEILDDVSEDIDKDIDDRIKTIEEEIEEKLEDIHILIDEGEEIDLDLKVMKEELNSLEDDLSSEEQDDEEVLKKAEKLFSELSEKVAIKKDLDKIEEKVEQHDDILEKKRISEIEDSTEDIRRDMEQNNLEKAKNDSKTLLKDIKTEIEDIKKKEDKRKTAEKTIKKGRKLLADLRDEDFQIQKPKNLLKDSTKAWKKGNLEKSIEYGEKMVNIGEKIFKSSDISDQIEEVIIQLDEEDLADKERLLYELEQYKKLVDNAYYEQALDMMSSFLDEVTEALEEETSLAHPTEKEIDVTAAEIKSKVKDLKDFKFLVENSGIKDVEFDKEYLKKAILKVKDMEYDEAAKSLIKGKREFVEEIGDKIEKRSDHLDKKIDDIEVREIKEWGDAILESISNKWKRGDHLETIEDLIDLNGFLSNISKEEGDQNKRLYLIKKFTIDMDQLGVNTRDAEELEDEFEDLDTEDSRKELLDEFAKDLINDLRGKLQERSTNLRSSLENYDRRKTAIMIENLMGAKSALKRKNLGELLWYFKEYERFSSEGDSESEVE